MIDVSLIKGTSEDTHRITAVLEKQNFQVSTSQGGTVTVVDGSGMANDPLDALVASVASETTKVLVLFTLHHGSTFRDRRNMLLSLGAADVMSAQHSEVELVTRVRALMHLSRKPRILVVEDEDKIGNWAVDVLNAAGMDATRAASLAEARASFAAGAIDALVVDRMLPDGDGLDFITSMRAQGFRTPSILFTALSDIEDRIAGLEGADDYICKPVHKAELVARVKVQLRPIESGDTMIFGALEIGRRDKVVKWRGDKIAMRPRECQMLIYLADRAEIPIPQSMIYLDVWGMAYMDEGSNPITAARHRMVKDIRNFISARGDIYPEFLETEGDAYVFRAGPLLQVSENAQ